MRLILEVRYFTAWYHDEYIVIFYCACNISAYAIYDYMYVILVIPDCGKESVFRFLEKNIRSTMKSIYMIFFIGLIGKVLTSPDIGLPNALETQSCRDANFVITGSTANRRFDDVGGGGSTCTQGGISLLIYLLGFNLLELLLIAWFNINSSIDE